MKLFQSYAATVSRSVNIATVDGHFDGYSLFGFQMLK
jgi:hypothetical protein